MRYRLFALVLLSVSFAFSDSAELSGTIYGIALGESLDTLNGEKIRLTGTMTIKGIQHETYSVDVSIYEPDPPFDQVVVQVEKKSREIKSITALVEIPLEECRKASMDLKGIIEVREDIRFEEFEYQGDDFYQYEEANIFILIGCQSKHQTLLQYQIGQSTTSPS